jgi:hypothetical protein
MYKLTRPALAVAVALLFVIPQGSASVFALAVACSLSKTQKRIVISTGGGAFAAVVERPPHFAFVFAIVVSCLSSRRDQSSPLPPPSV